MRASLLLGVVASFLGLPLPLAQAEVTAALVNVAIARGVAYLEAQQTPQGNWKEIVAEPVGVSALCTLALLHAGRTTADPSVKNALAYFDRSPDPERTYSTSLLIMAYARADPRAYAARIKSLTTWLVDHQVREKESKGGWTYARVNSRAGADNSNTRFAILALHEAEKAGVTVPEQTWRLARDYWTKPRMQHSDGAYGYLATEFPTGSMTCAAIASLLMTQDRLAARDGAGLRDSRQDAGDRAADDSVERALDWVDEHFGVTGNPGPMLAPNWTMYYLHTLSRVGELTGRRYFDSPQAGNKQVVEKRDWYREGCEHLLSVQDKTLHCWSGTGAVERDPLIATSFAVLFLAQGRRPVILGAWEYEQPRDRDADLQPQRRVGLQNLTVRVEREWQRDLAWQTIRPDTAAEMLAAPVLLLSGTQALDLRAAQKKALEEYVGNGGLLLAEATGKDAVENAPFDRSFRALMIELFPGSQLRKLPFEHPVWNAELPVNIDRLPREPEFAVWGLDGCCRTSVIYCPLSLSRYWQLANPSPHTFDAPRGREEIESVTRLGVNIVTYATGRDLKERLDRPDSWTASSAARAEMKGIVIPKLNHGGGANDAPHALERLLSVVRWRYDLGVADALQLVAATDKKLTEYPIVFVHGRRAFEFSPPERQSLKAYLDGGGFLFADAIGGSEEFAASFRAELKAIIPDAQLTRVPSNHALFTEEFPGFRLTKVKLRDPQAFDIADKLADRIVEESPRLEGLEVAGRLAVVFSPHDISCALEGGAALEHKGYLPVDAARLGANVILYALQRKHGRLR